MSLVDPPPVERVREVLAAKGDRERIIERTEPAATAADAARALGVALGAITKPLLLETGFDPALVAIAGDRRCREGRLPELFDLEGDVRRADAERGKKITGFPIGGVAPVGSLTPLPPVIDRGLGRFPRICAAAGHPRCVFETEFDELLHLTGGKPSDEISE